MSDVVVWIARCHDIEDTEPDASLTIVLTSEDKIEWELAGLAQRVGASLVSYERYEGDTIILDMLLPAFCAIREAFEKGKSPGRLIEGRLGAGGGKNPGVFGNRECYNWVLDFLDEPLMERLCPNLMRACVSPEYGDDPDALEAAVIEDAGIRLKNTFTPTNGIVPERTRWDRIRDEPAD
jgi:hypothetical protein